MIPIRFTLFESRPPEVTVRAWRELRREGLRQMGLYWHRHFLPRHFEPAARYRYRYQPRSKQWRERKRQLAARGQVKLGGEADLVASGLLRDTLTRFATIRPYQNRATLRMTGPRYITMKPRDTRQPHKALEVTTVIQAEGRDLSRMFVDHMTAGLNRIREPLVTT